MADPFLNDTGTNRPQPSIFDGMDSFNPQMGGTNAPRPSLAPSVQAPPPVPQPSFEMSPMQGIPQFDPQGKPIPQVGTPMPVLGQKISDVPLPNLPEPQMDSLATGGMTAPQAPQPTLDPRATSNGQVLPQPQAPFATGTPQEGSRAEQIRREVFENPLYGNFNEAEKRKMAQDLMTKEVKSGIGARAIIGSLEQEGMTRDEIRKAIGADANPNMSKAQALTELSRLQKSRAKGRSEGGLDNKVRDLAVDNARFDVDEAGDQIAKNVEARAKQAIDRLDDFGPDPESETSLFEYLTPSEQRQATRESRSMAQGTNNPNGERRFMNMLDKAEERRERDYMKKQAKDERQALTLASKRARTAEQNSQISAIKSSLSEIKDRLEAKKDKPSKEERKTLLEQQRQYIGQLNAFAEGAQAGAEAGAEAGNEATVIQAFMNANPGMSEDDARKEAMARGYIK